MNRSTVYRGDCWVCIYFDYPNPIIELEYGGGNEDPDMKNYCHYPIVTCGSSRPLISFECWAKTTLTADAS